MVNFNLVFFLLRLLFQIFIIFQVIANFFFFKENIYRSCWRAFSPLFSLQDELARVFVTLFDAKHLLVPLLWNMFYKEVEVSDCMQTLFRGNSLGSKIMAFCFKVRSALISVVFTCLVYTWFFILHIFVSIYTKTYEVRSHILYNVKAIMILMPYF